MPTTRHLVEYQVLYVDFHYNHFQRKPLCTFRKEQLNFLLDLEAYELCILGLPIGQMLNIRDKLPP